MADDKDDKTEDMDATEDVDAEEDTEDVKVSGEDTDASEKTKKKRSPRRIRLPSKAEIIAAVEEQDTENLDVDPLIKEAAQMPTVEDVD